MSETLVISSLTDRYQTTVPESVRKILDLNKRDRIEYQLNSHGEILIKKLSNDEDPTLSHFLSFLEQDIQKNPQNLQLLDNQRVQQARDLTADTVLDLDAALTDDD